MICMNLYMCMIYINIRININTYTKYRFERTVYLVLKPNMNIEKIKFIKLLFCQRKQKKSDTHMMPINPKPYVT